MSIIRRAQANGYLNRGRIATHLPPSPIEVRAQRGIDPVRGILLHAGNQMAVDVERDRNAGMAGALARHLRMHAGGEQVAHMGVSEFVETDPEPETSGQCREGF